MTQAGQFATIEADVEVPNYESTFRDVQPGDIINGYVVSVERDEVLVDVGGKTEGTISRKELSAIPVQDARQVVKPGDELEVFVIRIDDEEGVTRTSASSVRVSRVSSRAA